MDSFKTYISEQILSIGFNPEHEKYRNEHKKEMHDLLKNAYSHPSIGGYGGHVSGSKEESDAIYSDIDNLNIKAVKKKQGITAVNVYKDKNGRKLIAVATDGTKSGKKRLDEFSKR